MRIQQDFLDNVVKIYTGNYERLQLFYIYIISGWNIDNSKFTFANVLIDLACCAVYKAKDQYQFQLCLC